MYKQKIENLLQVLSESQDACFVKTASKLIKQTVQSFGDYVDKVVSMEAEIQHAHFRMETEDLREFIQRLDSGRRICHEACLSNINIVNRVGLKMLGSPIFNIDGMDRTEIADKVIFPCAKEYFDMRQK